LALNVLVLPRLPHHLLALLTAIISLCPAINLRTPTLRLPCRYLSALPRRPLLPLAGLRLTGLSPDLPIVSPPAFVSLDLPLNRLRPATFTTAAILLTSAFALGKKNGTNSDRRHKD
jgi:hypothetical protein